MFSGYSKYGKLPKGGKHSGWHKKLLSKWSYTPNCYWCNEPTNIDGPRGCLKTNPLYATLDHIYSNNDLRRLLPGGEKVVVACAKCNNKRAAYENGLVYQNCFDVRNNEVSIIDLFTNKVSVQIDHMTFSLFKGQRLHNDQKINNQL